MSSELHERARMLADSALVEGTSQEEQRWLAGHLADCAECSQYVELSRRAIGALQAFAFDVDAAGALRVQEAVRVHAARRRDLSKGITLAMVLTIIGSAVAWIPAGWMATRWNWPVPGWQIGFAIFWLLPSVLLTALLIFHGKLAGHPGDAI